jgi:DNA-binding response OmpR family regulator
MMKERERDNSLWVVSDDEELCNRIKGALHDDNLEVCIVHRAQVTEGLFCRTAKTLPGAVLLDVDEDLDWGVTVLKEIKRAHNRTPLVVVSRNPSREFGMKIVSAGINYLLPRDFDVQELRDVVSGLIRN